MQLVMLAGELGEKYGTQHEYYNLRTPADAIKLLCVNYPQLQKDLVTAHENGIGYKLIQSGAAMGYDELHLPFGSKPMMLVPVISGSGGSTRNILLGVGLVAFSIVTAGAGAGFLGLGAGLTGAIGAGGSLAAGGFVLGSAASIAIGSIGASMILSGVANLISPQPELPKLGNNRFDNGTNVRGTGAQGVTRGADGQQSYGFSGPANTVGTGATVPVIYGEVITGGHLIAVDLQVTDDSDRLAKTIVAPDVSRTTINGERLKRVFNSAAGLDTKRLKPEYKIRTTDLHRRISINQGFGPGLEKTLEEGRSISNDDLIYKKGENKRKKIDVIFKIEGGLFDRISGAGSTEIPGFISYEVKLVLERPGEPNFTGASAGVTVQGLFHSNETLVYGHRFEVPRAGKTDELRLRVEIVDAETVNRTKLTIIGYGYDLI
jgi:predicted phage tail protein